MDVLQLMPRWDEDYKKYVFFFNATGKALT